MIKKSNKELVFVEKSEKLSRQDSKNIKSALAKDINGYLKEIAWITINDNNGREISKYYLGTLREPQLRKLRRELKALQNQRTRLDYVDYINKLHYLVIEEWKVTDQYCEFLFVKYEDFLFASFSFKINLKLLLPALLKIITR